MAAHRLDTVCSDRGIPLVREQNSLAQLDWSARPRNSINIAVRELKLLKPHDHRRRRHNEPFRELVDRRPACPPGGRKNGEKAVTGDKQSASKHLGLAFSRLRRTGSTPRPTVVIERDRSGARGLGVQQPVTDLVGDREPSQPRVRLELREVAVVEDHESISSQERAEHAFSVALVKRVPEEAEFKQVEQDLGVEPGIETETAP